MNLSLQALPELAAFIFLASLKATLLVALVLLIQRVAGRLLSAGARYVLWLSVVIGLVTPVGFDTALHAALLPDMATAAPAALSMQESNSLPPPEPRATFSGNIPAQPAFSLPAQSVQVEPTVMTDPPFPWFQVLPYLWLAGVLIVLGTIAASSYRFALVVRRATTAPEAVQDFLKDCMRQTACTTRVSVLHSADVEVPMIAGLFKPVLLLPEGLEHQVSRAQLRHVFIHELMHLQRGDIVSNWIVALVQALHWFNPAVWYAFYRMRQDRELACDAATLNHLAPTDRAAYGHTLLQLNDTLPHMPVPVMALGILDSSSHLQERILMLVQSSRSKKLQSLFATLLFVPLAAVAFSQPAPRAAEAVPAALEPVTASAVPVAAVARAIAEPVITAEPAAAVAEPVAIVAEPAAVDAEPVQAAIPTPAELLVPAHTAPAAPAQEVRSEPAVGNAVLLAQLEPTPVAAPVAAATDTTDAGAVTIAREPSAEPDENLSAAIQRLADQISLAKSASIRFIEDLDSAATECAAKGDGIVAALSASCTKTRRALRNGGHIFQFGYQCYVLDAMQQELAARQRDAAVQQPVVGNLLRENAQNLASFCSKEIYGNDYPAFAALVPDAEYSQDYVLRVRQRAARAVAGRGFGNHGEINPGVMASSMSIDPSRAPAPDYTQGGTCCNGNTQPTYGTGFGPSDFGAGAGVPMGGGEAPPAPAP